MITAQAASSSPATLRTSTAPRADMPAERWPEIEDAIERLRPAAMEALMTIFQQTMSTQIDGAFKEIARRLSEQSR